MNATLTWNGSPVRDLEPVRDVREHPFRLLLEVEGRTWNAATTGDHLLFQKWIEAVEKLLNGAQTAIVAEEEPDSGFRLFFAGTDEIRMVRETLANQRVDKPVNVPLSVLARALLREGRALVRFKQKLLPKLPGLLDRVEWMLDRRTP